MVGASPERRARPSILALHEQLLNMTAVGLVDAACSLDDVQGCPDAARMASTLIDAFSAVTDAGAQITVWRRRCHNAHSPALQPA